MNESDNEQLLIGEVKLLLAEKRTYLAMYRTGVAVLGLSLTGLGVLVIGTGFPADLSLTRPLVISAVLIVIALVGAKLIYDSRAKINHIDELIEEIEEKDKRIAEIVIWPDRMMSKQVDKQKAFGCVPVCPQQGGLFLLVQNAAEDGSPDHWGFPKGHPQEFEYKVNTALRELEEETGLLPDELAKDEIFQESYEYESEEGRVDKRNTYYLALFAEPREPEGKTEEVLETRWVSFEEAKELMQYQSTRDVLTEAYMRLSMNGII